MLVKAKKNIGKSKIIDSLRNQSQSLEDLHKETKLAKPTILHHLNNLIKQGFVKKNEYDAHYLISVNLELRDVILDNLRENATLDNLYNRLKKEAKEKPHSKQLQELTKPKDAKEFLKAVLDFFFYQQLIIKFRFDPIAIQTTQTVWALSWYGCQVIKVCYVCKQYILPNEKIILHSMQVESTQNPLAEHYAPMIHTGCFMREYDELEIHLDLCHYCGLPLSRKRLSSLISYNSDDVISFLSSMLNLNENYLFTKYVHHEIKNWFKGDYGIKLSDNDILAGGVSLDQEHFEIIKEENPRLLDQIRLSFTHPEDPETYFLPVNRGSFFFQYGHNTRADFASFFYELDQFAEKTNENIRIYNEERIDKIFTAWRNHIKQGNDAIDQLFSDPIEKIYSSLRSGSMDYSVSLRESLMDFVGFEKPVEYSFSQFENGHLYHPHCYKQMKLENFQDDTTKDSSKRKRG